MTISTGPVRPWVGASLRLLLVLLGLGGAVVALWLIPAIAAEIVAEDSSFAPLHVPYVAAAIAAIACGEAVIVAIWRLLSLAEREAVFSGQALRWVDVATIALTIAFVLTLAVTIHASSTPSVGPITVLLLLAGIAVAESTVILLLIVLRSLLVAATADRDELAAVI